MYQSKRFILLALLTTWICFSSNSGLAQSNFWEQTNGPEGANIDRLHLHNNGDLFLSTLLSKHIYRSSDNGETWSKSNDPAVANQTVEEMVFSENGDLLAAVGDMGVFRSSDNGVAWSTSSGGLIDMNIERMVAKRDGDLFVSAGSLFRSVDEGDTWDLLNPSIDSDFITVLGVHPNGDIYAGGNA